VYPIVRLGNQREIEIDDIFAMPPEYESKGLREKLKKYYIRLHIMLVLQQQYFIFITQIKGNLNCVYLLYYE